MPCIVGMIYGPNGEYHGTQPRASATRTFSLGSDRDTRLCDPTPGADAPPACLVVADVLQSASGEPPPPRCHTGQGQLDVCAASSGGIPQDQARLALWIDPDTMRLHDVLT